MFVVQYAFVQFEEASGLVMPPGTTSFFVAKVSAGDDAAVVAGRIEESVPGVVAFTASEFAEINRKLVAESFDPILFVLYAIGGLTGILVIGLTVYTATIERTKEYGVLKAIGASNGRLFRILLGQALYLATAGFLAGLAITAVAVVVVSHLVASMNFYFPLEVFPTLLLATVAMGILAAYIPMRKVARIDPAVVFRRG